MRLIHQLLIADQTRQLKIRDNLLVVRKDHLIGITQVDRIGDVEAAQ